MTQHNSSKRYVLYFMLILLWGLAGRQAVVPSLQAASKAKAAAEQSANPVACHYPLPAPSSLTLEAFEQRLYAFLEARCYDDQPGHLGWAADKKVRDTGPLLNGQYYGTHSAIKVYYAPDVMAWLHSGRLGKIPDGAIMVAETYDPPAQLHQHLSPAELRAKVTSWTVMVKDQTGSWDGWFWGFYSPGQPPEDASIYPFDYANAGFGQYCVNCHASASSESTFAALRNIRGAPGEPLTYLSELPTMAPLPPARPGIQTRIALGAGAKAPRINVPRRDANPEFLALFDELTPAPRDQVRALPPETYDHVVASPDGATLFLTSDQCVGCHNGGGTGLGVDNMIHTPQGVGKPLNLSPYGEWRASPMSLSGRNPVFLAQLESELALHPRRTAEIQQLCFGCHGVMGQRQLSLDTKGEQTFTRQMLDATTTHEPVQARYGALARDGVSCTACHRMAPRDLGTPATFSGNFHLGPADTIYGPYEDALTLPMRQALGLRPQHGEHLTSAKLCGSCHTLKLPVYDNAGHVLKEVFVHTTYLEWLNSAYQNDSGPNPQARTCQSCHMPQDYHSTPLKFRIANIQTNTFPATEHLAPLSAITPKVRQPFARHTLLGINLFLLEMFQQFNDLLGLRIQDPMNPATQYGLLTAEVASHELATQQTAAIEIRALTATEQQLEAEVHVTNLAGHKLPSGAIMRRAFLHFEVLDACSNVLWASGRTSPLGVMVDETGEPLPTELLSSVAQTGEPPYQPHHEVITQQDQVQIYEERIKSPEGKFTTSFLSLDQVVKDNRLLPKGWKRDGAYAEHTAPKGQAAQDPRYLDGSGSDSVRYRIPLDQGVRQAAAVVATLYYQSIPPAYLQDRFTAAAGPDTQRLHYIGRHLYVAGTPIDQWRIKIASVKEQVGSGGVSCEETKRYRPPK